VKLPVILLSKGTSGPVYPLLKGKVVNAPVMPPSLAFTVWHFATKCAMWNSQIHEYLTTSPNREIPAT